MFDRAVFLNLAVTEADQTLGVHRDIRFVRYEHDRHVLFVVNCWKIRMISSAVFESSAPRRLVGKNDRRMTGERARQRHALLLSA
jgi:hypothetical protein